MKSKVTEEKYEIYFRHDGNVELDGCTTQEAGDSVVVCSKIDNIEKTAKQIAEIDDLKKIRPLLRKKCCLCIENEMEAYSIAGALFVPLFKTTDLTVTNISFYTEVNEKNYNVDIEYDFENNFKIDISRFIETKDEINEYLSDMNQIIEDIVEGVENYVDPGK